VKKRTKTRSSTSSDISDRFIDVKEIPVYVKALIYGPSGTGKTTFMGSFPKPLLVIDCRDMGTKSIRTAPDTKVLSVTSWNDIEEAYWYLKNNPTKFKSVIWDTITQAQDLCMKKVKGQTLESASGKTTRNAWGEVGEMMKSWILLFRDLDMHVGFTAQDRLKSNEEETEDDMMVPQVGPFASPSVVKILNAAVDVIGYSFIREIEVKKTNPKTKKIKTSIETQYCLRVGPHSRYITKIRNEAGKEYPHIVVNAKYDDILKIIL